MAERDPRTTHPVPTDLVERLVAGVRQGADGVRGLFPPVVGPGPRGSLCRLRELTGPDDADALARTLALTAYAPARRTLRALDSWCAEHSPAAEADGLLAPDVLSVANGGLFGPLVTEVLAVCGRAPKAPRVDPEVRGAQWQRFLARFLYWLAQDRAALVAADPALCGPVVDLWAHGDETHNGGRRVLRVTFAGGGRLAYKDRPAGGEALFTAARTSRDSEPPSVFALLNELPPASGPVRLPVLNVLRPHPPYGPTWQEWIEPTLEQGVLRAEDGHQLTGTVLAAADTADSDADHADHADHAADDQAGDFWHDAGGLAAVAYGLGIADLTGDNVLTGRRPGRDETPRAYAVDTEAFLTDVRRLHHTSLTEGGTTAATHHVGFEVRARWCDHGEPALVWRYGADGGLRLTPPDTYLARTTTRSVVGDSTGATGYGPHLTALARGMFDAWTLLCRHRDRVLDHLTTRTPHTYRRVIPRPTSEYHAALATDTSDGRFSPVERDQLAAGDVPYVFQRSDGGPLLALDSAYRPPHLERPGQVPVDGVPDVPLPDAAHHHARLTLAGLGAALRDAAEGVFDTLTEGTHTDPVRGVTLRLDSPHDGYASFDWLAAGRRVSYLWGPVKLRLRIEDLQQPAEPVPVSPGVAIRGRLLRLNERDAALRTPWAAEGFTDTATAAQLERLTATGVDWLRTVIAAHGWPGESLVGAEAAGAACRLVQHATHAPDFAAHCLDLVRRAARAGDVPAREVAYLTDAVRLARGQLQLYGTKFQDVDGTLRPFPLEDPDTVDARRAELGMDSVERYAARLHTTFGIPTSPVSTSAAQTGAHPQEAL